MQTEKSKKSRLTAYAILIGLRFVLGNRCQCCGKKSRPRIKLEFDCCESRGDWHHKVEINRRAYFYLREFFAGNLGLLCARCHSAKTAQDIRQLDLLLDV